MVDKKKKSIFELLKTRITDLLFGVNDEITDEVPKSWKDEKVSSVEIKTSPKGILERPRIRKIKVPLLRKGKRYLAGLLLVLNIFCGVACLTNIAAQFLTIFFLLNSFICLDYLWKTKRRVLP